MSNYEPIDFDTIEEIQIPVKIKGKNYTLREATGDVASDYINARYKRVTYSADGRSRKLGDMGDLQPLLVSGCLYDEDGEQVDEDLIRSWPARVQRTLFERATEISQIDADNNTVREMLKEATKEVKPPFEYKKFVEWISKLSDDYRALKILFAEDTEETAKNEQSG